MSDKGDDNNNSRTKRLEAAFKNARVSYDELKEEFFKVKEDLTVANERLDQEYARWKKARHDNMARTPPTAITPYGAAAVAQTRFDNAQEEYNDIHKEFIRLEKAFKKKDAEMDKHFQKWASSRKGKLRKSTPAFWNRMRRACGEHIDLLSSSSDDEEKEKEKHIDLRSSDDEDEEEEEEEEEDKKLAAVSRTTTAAAPLETNRTRVAARRLARKTPSSGPLPSAKRQQLKKAPPAASNATSTTTASHVSRCYLDQQSRASPFYVPIVGKECTPQRNSATLHSQQQAHRISHFPSVPVPWAKASVRKSPREIATAASATAKATPITPKEEEENDNEEETETESIRNDARPSLPLQRSVGRSRDWLNLPENMSRLEPLGIFAKFGQSSFATSENIISHLVFNNEWNQLPTRSDETWTLYVGTGPILYNCAERLAGMRSSVPVFFDFKQRGHPIHYVGHWKPIPGSAVEYPEGKYRRVRDRDRCMKIDLRLERFDEDFSAVMDG